MNQNHSSKSDPKNAKAAQFFGVPQPAPQGQFGNLHAAKMPGQFGGGAAPAAFGSNFGANNQPRPAHFGSFQFGGSASSSSAPGFGAARTAQQGWTAAPAKAPVRGLPPGGAVSAKVEGGTGGGVTPFGQQPLIMQPAATTSSSGAGVGAAQLPYNDGAQLQHQEPQTASGHSHAAFGDAVSAKAAKQPPKNTLAGGGGSGDNRQIPFAPFAGKQFGEAGFQGGGSASDAPSLSFSAAGAPVRGGLGISDVHPKTASSASGAKNTAAEVPPQPKPKANFGSFGGGPSFPASGGTAFPGSTFGKAQFQTSSTSFQPQGKGQGQFALPTPNSFGSVKAPPPPGGVVQQNKANSANPGQPQQGVQFQTTAARAAATATTVAGNKAPAVAAHAKSSPKGGVGAVASSGSGGGPLRLPEVSQCSAQSSATGKRPERSPNIMNETSVPRTDLPPETLEIASYDLPPAITLAYETQKNLKTLYPWQRDCLHCHPKVLKGKKNLIYCAPTSGGKTLVAELLMLRAVSLLGRGPALLILPYVSIVSEKEHDLKVLCQAAGLTVRAFFGGSQEKITDPFDIGICTIEKANFLINLFVEERQLHKLSMVVVDELHLLADSSRGYLVEVILAKLLYMAPRVQLVGMSATMPNVPQIAEWLKAVLYVSSYRPVTLQEMVCCWKNVGPKHQVDVNKIKAPDGAGRATGEVGRGEQNQMNTKSRKLLDEKGEFIRDFAQTYDNDNECLFAAVMEVFAENHSSLVFCKSRAACEETAKLISSRLPVRVDSDNGREVVFLPHQPNVALEFSVPRGVAYHHAGLCKDDRLLIERLYRAGKIKVLCATSTLAAGVNLPARRVIFRGTGIGREQLSIAQYKQMSGRAGRKGESEVGESIILTDNLAKALALMNAPMTPLRSCMDEGGLRRLILDMLCVRSTTGCDDGLIELADCTFLVHAQKPMALEAPGAGVDKRKKKRRTENHDAEQQGVVGSSGKSAPAGGGCGAAAALHGKANGKPPQTPGGPHQAKNQAKEQHVDVAVAHPDLTNAMAYLLSNEVHPALVEMDGLTQRYSASKLGQAIVAAGLTIEAGLQTYENLRQASQRLLLETELHICYLCTPLQSINTAKEKSFLDQMAAEKAKVTTALAASENGKNPDAVREAIAKSNPVLAGQMRMREEAKRLEAAQVISNPDWRMYGKIMRSLSAEEERVATLVGVHADLVDDAALQKGSRHPQVYRFYAAYLLCILRNGQIPMDRIAGPKGHFKQMSVPELEQLQLSCVTYCFQLQTFCAKLRWEHLETLIREFAQRLNFGNDPHLVPLMEIEGMSHSLAKLCYDDGFNTCAKIAAADDGTLLKVMRRNLGEGQLSTSLTLEHAAGLRVTAGEVAKLQKTARMKATKEEKAKLRNTSNRKKEAQAGAATAWNAGAGAQFGGGAAGKFGVGIYGKGGGNALGAAGGGYLGAGKGAAGSFGNIGKYGFGRQSYGGPHPQQTAGLITKPAAQAASAGFAAPAASSHVACVAGGHSGRGNAFPFGVPVPAAPVAPAPESATSGTNHAPALASTRGGVQQAQILALAAAGNDAVPTSIIIPASTRAPMPGFQTAAQPQASPVLNLAPVVVCPDFVLRSQAPGPNTGRFLDETPCSFQVTIAGDVEKRPRPAGGPDFFMGAHDEDQDALIKRRRVGDGESTSFAAGGRGDPRLPPARSPEISGHSRAAASFPQAQQQFQGGSAGGYQPLNRSLNSSFNSASSPPDGPAILELAKGLKKLGRRSITADDFAALGTSAEKLESILRKMNRDSPSLREALDSPTMQQWRDEQQRARAAGGDAQNPSSSDEGGSSSPTDLLNWLGQVRVERGGFAGGQTNKVFVLGGAGPGSPQSAECDHQLTQQARRANPTDGRCARWLRIGRQLASGSQQFSLVTQYPAAHTLKLPRVHKSYDPLFLQRARSSSATGATLPSVLAMSVHSSSEQQHGVGTHLHIVVVFPGQWWVCRPEDMRDWFLAGSREQNDHGKNVIVCADAKAFARVLQTRGIDARRTCHFAEPRVAEWMLDPESMSELGDLRAKYGVPEIVLMNEDVVGQGTEKQHQLMHAAFHEDLRLYKRQLKQEDEKGGIAGAAAPAASTFQAVRPERNKAGAAFAFGRGFDLDAAHASLRAFEQGMPPALGNFVAGVPSFPTTSAAPGAQRHHAQQQRQLPPLQLQRTSFPLLHCVNEAFSCLYLMSAIFSSPPTIPPSAAYAVQVKRELQAAFTQQIMPFHLVIGQMEDQGMPFDVNWPSYFRIVYKTAALQERAKEIVGRRINLASTEDCGVALFEDLDIPVPQGVRFARKKNGRKKFRSPKEILQAVLREEEARVAAEAAAAVVESPGKAANAAVQPAAAASLDCRGEGNRSNFSKPSKSSLSSGNTSSSDDNASDEDEELGSAKQSVPGKKSGHGDQGDMISEAEESDNDDVNEGGDQGGSKTEPECFLPNQFWARNPGFELIDHITEYRHLTHVQTKFNKLRRCAAPEHHQGAQYNLQRGGPSTSATGGAASSSLCAAPLPKSVAPLSAIADRAAAAPGEAEGQASSGLPHRVRTTFAYTATGRIVVRCGGPQLLCVDNPFEIIDVTRPSFQQERIKQLLKPVPVLVGVAAALPPMCRYRNGYALWVGGEDDDSRSRRGEQLQQDHLAVRMQEREELENAGGRKNAVDRVVWDDSIASVCEYWADRGWKIYENADYVKTLRRVIVQLGNFSGNTLDDYDPESPNASNTSRKLLAFFNKDTTAGDGQPLQERGGVGDGTKIDRRSYLSYPSDQVWRSQAPVFAGAIAQNQNQNALAGAEDGKSGAATSATRPTTTHRRISVNLRECFRFPRSTRKLLLSVDYCQLEVRLLAYYSGDKSLQAHLINTQTDLFRAIAAQWLQKSEQDIGAEERAGAKKIVYGLIYGMGPKRVSADLGISEAEGRNFMKRFDEQFPKVKDWVKAVRKGVVETREITTLYGRKRFFHAGCPRTEAEYREMLLAAGAPARADVNKGAGKGAARSKAPPFRQLVSKIERQGVNSICQASAADLMMQAMLNLDKATLRIPVCSTTSPCMSPAHSSSAPAAARNQEEFNCKPLLDYHNAADYQVGNGGPTTSTLTPPSSCRLILQIHDELLFEVADDVLPLALPVIVECMTRPGADIAPVPLQVKCRVGTDWGNLKEVDLKK